MRHLLLVETSSAICSIAVSRNKQIIGTYQSMENNHAEFITIGISHSLTRAQIVIKDIDAVVVSGGPGSYTGLRIGLSVAKGLCYALSKPLIMIDTLQSLYIGARQAASADYYCTTIDNRRNELFYSLFDNYGKCIIPTKLSTIEDELWDDINTGQGLFENKKVVISGNAFSKLHQLYRNIINVEVPFDARHMLPIALEKYEQQDFVDVAYCEPLYHKEVYTVHK
jgi:tRNA threonylcarbamoyladenosine biosynthesis protein TsaB